MVSDNNGLKAFQNRVLRRIFRPKTDKAIGGRRKLHNEVRVLHTSYSSPNIIKIKESRMMRWARHVARMKAKKNAYRILGKPERKRPLGTQSSG